MTDCSLCDKPLLGYVKEETVTLKRKKGVDNCNTYSKKRKLGLVFSVKIIVIIDKTYTVLIILFISIQKTLLKLNEC